MKKPSSSPEDKKKLLAIKSLTTSQALNFFDKSPDLFCVAGPNAVFEVVNDQWTETLGYSKEELTTNPFINYVHPEDRKATLDRFQDIMDGNCIWDFVNRYRAKDGTYKYFLWSVTPSFQDKTCYGIAKDITNIQAKLTNLSEHFNHSKEGKPLKVPSTAQALNFFEKSPDLFCVAAQSAIFDIVNDQWTKTLGYTKEELTTNPFINYVHPDDRKATLDRFQDIMDGNCIWDFINRYRAKDGSYKYFLWSVTPSHIDGTCYGIAKDITNIHQKLDKLSTRISGEEKGLCELHSFISTMTDRLRSSLDTLCSSLDKLDKTFKDKLPDQAKLLLESATKDSEKMMQLLNDALDIESIELGKTNFQLKPLNLDDILKQSISSNKELAEKYNAKITLKTDNLKHKVMADQSRLSQVITSLVSSAIESSPKGSEVIVKLEHDNGKAKVSVIDKRPGLSKEFQKQAFKKFAHMNALNQKQNQGLGLPLSKLIIEKMEGEIGLNCHEEEGTTFYFTLNEQMAS